ncbi:TetR/AcrR family transcriptional regulator [Sphingopyxis sp. PET50]|uniref:TetR/AcrR family transcriptional regulator n=1 Tax=Sphingopyxis sp. PET50 TaxID=2976533 RepID=UPI0021AFEE1A|nr:TetR/AcrR family transcriptional regulator [Sphingopyxis sp. PET50]
MAEQLTKTAWLDHGLSTLARDGIHAVKAEPMAKALAVSRGSFYWHFRDIADFRTQLLQRWQESMTDRIIAEHAAGNESGRSLQQLIRRGFGSRQRLDHAVRLWALDDPAAASAVAIVDGRRIDHIATLIEEAGIDRETARARATFLYWAVLGQALVAAPGLASLPEAKIDAIGHMLSSPVRSP